MLKITRDKYFTITIENANPCMISSQSVEANLLYMILTALVVKMDYKEFNKYAEAVQIEDE
jgi:hypothetical protein